MRGPLTQDTPAPLSGGIPRRADVLVKRQVWMSGTPAWKPGLYPELGQSFRFLACKMGMMIIELTSKIRMKGSK